MAALLRSSQARIAICRYAPEASAVQATHVRGISTTGVYHKLHKKKPKFVHADTPSVNKLIQSHGSFLRRHIGPSSIDLLEMLRVVSAKVGFGIYLHIVITKHILHRCPAIVS